MLVDNVHLAVGFCACGRARYVKTAAKFFWIGKKAHYIKIYTSEMLCFWHYIYIDLIIIQFVLHMHVFTPYSFYFLDDSAI